METLQLQGAVLDVLMAGAGRPLVHLHAEHLYDATRPHLDALAARHRLIAPRHPGFTSRPMPDGIRTVDDLAYLYLDMLDRLGLDDVVLVGASFGGWLALEMCVRNISRISRLVLVSPVGVKLSNREERDFADLFYLPDDKAWELLLADPARWAPRYTELDPAAVETIAREKQATAYFGWKPYLHKPGLERWLHRVAVPTLVIGGEQDRFASPAYARNLAGLLPDAELRIVPGAGHYPHVEQSARVVGLIEAFVGC
jgi:pimeloyl-ACP methyl ester carboxylesterase